MRSVPFSGLLGILRLVADSRDGLTAGELDGAVRKRGICLTQRGDPPARTTLYHCRNTLLQLGALRRDGRRLAVNWEKPYVQLLLDRTGPIDTTLGVTARQAFAALVLQNRDCRSHFFDLFTPDLEVHDVDQFRWTGHPIAWSWRGGKTRKEVILRSLRAGRSIVLRSPSEIKSVLYGLRYWARDELQLVDEFFREDVGSIIYPIVLEDGNSPPLETVRDILSLRVEGAEWTTVSMQQLAVHCCERRRRPLARLLAAIKWLADNHSGRVILIPTSRSLATLTARSPRREEFELRGYFRDVQGRYISHLRLHNSIWRLTHGDVP